MNTPATDAELRECIRRLFDEELYGHRLLLRALAAADRSMEYYLGGLLAMIVYKETREIIQPDHAARIVSEELCARRRSDQMSLVERLKAVETLEELAALLSPLVHDHKFHVRHVPGCLFCEGAATQKQGAL